MNNVCLILHNISCTSHSIQPLLVASKSRDFSQNTCSKSRSSPTQQTKLKTSVRGKITTYLYTDPDCGRHPHILWKEVLRSPCSFLFHISQSWFCRPLRRLVRMPSLLLFFFFCLQVSFLSAACILH